MSGPTALLLLVSFWSSLMSTCHAQRNVDRFLTAAAASSDGSVVLFTIQNRDLSNNLVVALRPGTATILWQHISDHLPSVLTISPDNRTVAVGFSQVNNGDAGVLLLDLKTGKQTGALGPDDKSDFVPGIGYNTWGDGVVGLAFSPDRSILYGVSDDTLFAWDLEAKRYLWTKDVPGVFVTPKDRNDILPYGHSTALALSPDGNQIVVARTVLRVASAGRTRPRHFVERGSGKLQMMSPGRPVFSANTQVLAAGDVSALTQSVGRSYALEYWIGSNPKGQRMAGCGGGLAWTNDPDLFGCQDAAGAHLRSIHNPTANIGVAGPLSDLPILKVGNSLWAIAYKNGDWQDGAKPLPLTMIEIGTGRDVSITLPGR